MRSAARSSSAPRTPPITSKAQSRSGVGNGVSEKAQAGPRRTDRLGRDAAIPRVVQLLQHRRLSARTPTWTSKADPYGTTPGGCGCCGNPPSSCRADLRVFLDHVETTAYYYIIPRDDEANPFSSFTTPPNANDITSPIQTNNLGTDNRDVTDVALKLDYRRGPGNVHGDLGLQPHQGDRHRRCLRLPARSSRPSPITVRSASGRHRRLPKAGRSI